MEKDASLLTDLESLLEPKGDPMSLLKWTTKSVAHLQEALERMGHEVAQTTIRRILHARGYSLRANKKNIEGKSHPDREAQFEHIHTACQEFDMTFSRWPMAKPSPMGSTIWFTITGSSMWALIMTRRSLRWKASDAGGSSGAKHSIQGREGS